MARSFSYPVHFDSHQANAWVAHREESCNERSKTGYRPDSYGVLTRHRFSTSVIVTLQAPDRDKDPHDLHVWRVRWPALVFNCSVKTVQAYGIGVRLDNLPKRLLEGRVDIKGDPGDVYMFNSEFIHDTPKITGDSSRMVIGGVVGYSRNEPLVEVWS